MSLAGAAGGARAGPAAPSRRARGMASLVVRLAVQNLVRRRTRTLLLVAAVAIATGVGFAGAVLMRSIEGSMALGFTRLGADMMVVADDTLANITASLLVVEPTPHTLPRTLLEDAALSGVGRVAPQRTFRTTESRYGALGETVDFIGFDPAADFTVLPWVEERLPGPMGFGDVVVGARRDVPIGSEIVLFEQPFRVWGRLGRSGVGTHEGGIFMSFETIGLLALAVERCEVEVPRAFGPDEVSGFLVELAPGATQLAARFALMSQHEGIKVVTGEGTLTAIRHALSLLVSAALALSAAMVLAIGIMTGVLFSAIVAERRREIGVLKAIGLRRPQLVGLIVSEAALATGLGGLVGVLGGIAALRVFERLLVGRLEGLGIPFAWLDGPSLLAAGLLALLTAGAVGAAGALVPALRASRRDGQDLLSGGS